LLFVEAWRLHNLIQRLYLIIFRSITFISFCIFICCFVSLYGILTVFVLTIQNIVGHLF
jgi:hypothetical protein